MAMRFVIDGEKYEFDMNSLMRSEVNAVKKATGFAGMAEWAERLQANDEDARDAMIWIAVKRSQPDLKFSDLDYNIVAFAESLEVDEEPDAETDPTASPQTTDPT